MDAAVSGLARGPRHNEADDEGGDPDGRGDEKRLDLAVAEGLDDGGEEVLEGLGEEGCVLQQSEDVEARIAHRQLDTLHDGRCFSVVGFARVVEETPLRIAALFRGKPARVGWVVGKDNGSYYCDANRNNA